MKSNPALLNLTQNSSYRDFHSHLVADMQAKWPLQNAPVLHPFAGGTGNYVLPTQPVDPPSPSPIQVGQRLTVEQLLLQSLRSPVRLAAGQWVNVINPLSSTHVGSEQNAVDLSLIGLANDELPNFDEGQPVYAPLAGTVTRMNRDAGSLVIEHVLHQADGTSIIITTKYLHVSVVSWLHPGALIKHGEEVGQIGRLAEGMSQVDAHLHFSVHLGSEFAMSIDLSQWLAQRNIATIIRDDGIDSGGGYKTLLDYVNGLRFFLNLNTIKALTNEAENETIRRFPSETSPLDKGNAFKHAYWSALLAAYFSPKVSKAITDGHELWLYNRNPPDQKAMDLHNNKIGIRIGAANHTAPNHVIANAVMLALNRGQLLIIRDGQLLPSNVSPVP